jgi:Zn-dependent membrane protease YugP
VNSTFRKYSAVRSLSGMTGAQAAQRILNQAGIYDVTIEHINGKLTDHYDPSNKVLRLSDSVYGSSSVAAIGVAAHECGHAIQHQHGYVPLRLRTAIVPLANFGSKISWPLIILGVFLSMSQTLIYAGIILFSFAVLFQIVTLPVEFNASRRAVKILDDSGILYGEEVQITKKVLGTAALTYVAGAAASVLQLLRLIRIFGGNNRD